MLVQKKILSIEEMNRIGVLRQTIVTKEILTDTDGNDQEMEITEVNQDLFDEIQGK